MAKLTPQEIAGYAQAAGTDFHNPQTLAIMVAIALAESGGETTAINTSNSNGSTDYGLFQINSVHKHLLEGKDWKNPDHNAKMAYSIYKSQGLRAWSVYKSGKYLAYLPQGQAGARNPAKVGTQDPTNPIPTPVNPPTEMNESLAVIGNFFKFITNPSTYVRLAMFLGGLIILVLAFYVYVKNTKAGRSVIKVGKSVVTKGVL